MSVPSDTVLVDQIRSGDSSGLHLLYDRYADEIWRVTLIRLRDPDAAWEVVQETFTRAAKHLQAFEGGDLVSHWLHRVAKNLSIDHVRQQRRVRPTDDLEIIDLEDERPESPLLKACEHRLVREAFGRLSSEDQAILWARDVRREPIDVLAAQYGMTNGAMRVKLARARTRLRLHAATVGLSAVIPAWAPWRGWATAPGPGAVALPALLMAASVVLTVPSAVPLQAGEAYGEVDSAPRVNWLPVRTPVTRAESRPVEATGTEGIEGDSSMAERTDPDAATMPVIEIGDEPPSEDPDQTIDLTPFGVPLKFDLWGLPGCCGALDPSALRAGPANESAAAR